MNRKGFALVETIVVVAILSAALLIIYSTYSKAIHKEKNRLYYDDVTYIHKANYLKTFLVQNTNITVFLKNSIKDKNTNASNTDDTLIVEVSDSTTGLFNPNTLISFQNLFSFYKVDRVWIYKPDYEIITQCSDKVLNGSKGSLTDVVYNTCLNSFPEEDYELTAYIRTLGRQEFQENYIFIATFKEHKDGSICTDGNEPCIYNYVWLDLGVSYE